MTSNNMNIPVYFLFTSEKSYKTSSQAGSSLAKTTSHPAGNFLMMTYTSSSVTYPPDSTADLFDAYMYSRRNRNIK